MKLLICIRNACVTVPLSHQRKLRARRQGLRDVIPMEIITHGKLSSSRATSFLQSIIMHLSAPLERTGGHTAYVLPHDTISPIPKLYTHSVTVSPTR